MSQILVLQPLILWVIALLLNGCASMQKIDLSAVSSPIIFKGDANTAYRDPAVIYDDQVFHLFFTLVEIESDGKVFSYTAYSKSMDLKEWDQPIKITPRDQSLNFSSPGNVIKFNDEWILCLQTYPRPDHNISQETRYGNKDARIFIMRSDDLKEWSKPALLKVKGPELVEEEMGRMIDPYLVEDKEEPGKWWCFYKQNGASMSYSYDLVNWTYVGRTEAGENVTVWVEDDHYWMLHSPKNGFGIKKSADLIHWEDWGSIITLNQQEWNWAKGRISAATLTDLRDLAGLNKYLLFFHGSGPETEANGDFDRNASLGLAWSDDLIEWEWPQMNNHRK